MMIALTCISARLRTLLLCRLLKPIVSLLPERPEQRAAVLDKLAGRSEVQEVEALRASTSSKQARAAAAILESLQQALRQLDYKSQAGRESAGRLARQIITAAASSPGLVDQRLLSECARILGCNRQALAVAVKKRCSSSGLDGWVLLHRLVMLCCCTVGSGHVC